jgi:hypothetical protein
MKITCHCGNILSDTTDFLSYKAHINPFNPDAKNRQKYSLPIRNCYQCTQCGWLHVDGPDGKLQLFVPESPAFHVLASSKGKLWRGILRAHWRDTPIISGTRKGELYCHSEDPEESAWEDYDSWEGLEQAYNAFFHRLKERDILRSALLTKNGAILHSWEYTSTFHPHGREKT